MHEIMHPLVSCEYIVQQKGTVVQNGQHLEIKCDNCFIVFMDQINFNQHHCNVANNDAYKCGLCDNRFAIVEDLMCHLKSHRSPIEESFHCYICSEGFHTREQLKEHMLFHNPVFKCQYCPKSFPLRKILNEHTKQHAGEKRLIDKDESKDEPFTWRYHDPEEEKELQIQEIIVDEPPKKRPKVEAPYPKIQETKNKLQTSLAKCKICKRTFKKKAYLVIHMRTHNKKLSHKKSNTIKPPVVLSRSERLEKRNKATTPKPVPNLPALQRLRNRKIIIKEAHNVETKTPEKTDNKEENEGPKKIDLKSTKAPEHEGKAMADKTGNMSAKNTKIQIEPAKECRGCEDVGKETKEEKDTERPPIANRRLLPNRNSALKRKAGSEQIKLGKRTAGNSLKMHSLRKRKRSLEQRMKKTVVKEGDDKTTQGNILNENDKIALAQKYIKEAKGRGPDGPARCKICGNKYRRKPDLIRHYRMHAGDHPYKCNLCNKSFYRADYLQKHLMSHR